MNILTESNLHIIKIL